MDTNRLKRFATEARNILMQGVVHRLSALGFLPDGSVREEPQQQGGGATFMGDTVTQDFYDKWQSLRRAVSERKIEEVAEEAAYTWFNRLVAIRILVKNCLASPVLEYESEDVLVPLLVSEARQGRMPKMDADSMRKLTELLDDDSKTNEQFALLIVAYCHENPIIHKCFGRISDYTELLLPTNILTEGGFVYQLNHTEFIAEEDFRSPELIGWLYQFYISERKDEVFASFKKGKKAEAKDIPAATQIFTPNWIVKYMVQNTVGRIYLDNNPYEAELQEKWQYLVEPSEKRSADSILKYDELTELRVADLACGSGHILNECFDLLYDLYIAEGYGRSKAIENIFRHNLTGVDLDTRAKQLATFALLLKACQKDNAFADAHCLPNVLDMPQCNLYTWRDTSGHFACWYQLSERFDGEELDKAFQLLEQAENLGSIMKFDISDDTRNYMKHCIQCYEDDPAHTEQFGLLIQGFRLILALTEKYHALVMNPPYMGGGNMNATLSKYVKDEYEEGKADMMTVFMVVAENHIEKNGKIGMITLPSWLFLSTFEKLRKNIVVNYHIDSLLHMGRGIFGIDWGSTAFVVSNCINHAGGTYFRLHKRNFQHIYYYHIEQLFLKALNNHDFKYDFDGYRDDDVVSKDIIFESSETGLQLYYPNVSQQDFKKIPGCPIGYWVSEKGLMSFSYGSTINEVATPRQGMATSDVNRFIKFWHEVSFIKIGLNKKNHEEALESKCKWFPHNKGGGIRKWYGNNYYVVNWENGGEEVLTFAQKLYGSPTRTIKNINYYFLPSVTWGMIGSGNLSVRRSFKGFLFDVGGPSAFEKDIPLDLIIAFLNSKVAFFYIKVLNPTLNYNSGDIGRLPYLIEKINNYQTLLKEVAIQNISISKQDWDAHETSWDFETNPLLAVDEETYIDNIHHEIERHEKETGEHLCIDPAAPELDSLEWRMEQYKQKWEHLFMQLHENEEELNRQFIDIYGLQDELTPDVPLDEITILQQGEVSIE